MGSSHDAEKKLNDTLKESFPASDANSSNEVDVRPVRPEDRKPAKIDKALVDKLAEEVRQKQREE